MTKKTKIRCQINDINIETTANIENDIIKFSYNDDRYTFDIKNKILVKNNEYILNFIKKVCTIDSDMSIYIDVLNINNYDNTICITYKISNQDFNLKLEYDI
ncbi:MAG TPA: hypothetical protein PLT65_03255 [Bacilli bacterium]|nr:hypothetical protein [Bacilli bacterium]